MRKVNSLIHLIKLLSIPYTQITFYEKVGTYDKGTPHFVEKERMWFFEQPLLGLILIFKNKKDSKFYYKKS